MSDQYQNQQEGKSEKFFKFQENSLPDDAADAAEEETSSTASSSESIAENDDERTKNAVTATAQVSLMTNTNSSAASHFHQQHYEQDTEEYDQTENLGASLLSDMDLRGNRNNSFESGGDGLGGDEYRLDTAAPDGTAATASSGGDSSFRNQYKEKREQRRRLMAGMAGGVAGLVMIGPCTAVAAGIGGAMLIKRLDRKRKEDTKIALRDNETETASLLSPRAQV